MRNKEMDLLKAIGIIYVLGGHYYLPCIFGYPFGSFFMPLFFFISGYFFKSTHGFREKLFYCSKKTKELLLPYFLYFVLFTTICFFLQMYFSINLISPGGSNHDLLTLPIVLILKPLFGGISIVFVASWFIADLWVITIIMQCIYSNKSGNKKIDFIYFGCFISLVFCAIHWSYTSPRSTDPPIPPNTSPLLEHNICKLVLIRTLFGSLFHFCGMFYHAHIEKHQKLLFTGKNFFIAFIAISQLQYHYGDDINFLLFNAEFKSAPIWVPISTSFIGIYLFMFIAKCASKHIHINDILIMISHETYHIMCQHMLIFLFLNIITVATFHDKNFKVLNGNAFYQYKPEINWFIYIGSGLLVPTFLAIYTRKVIKKVWRTAVSGILAKKRDD